MSNDDNVKRIPDAEPSQPAHPDEDGWESALADLPNVPPQTPAPPPMDAAPDLGAVTAPMPPVAPIAAPAPNATSPGIGPEVVAPMAAVAPASMIATPLHLQNNVPVAPPQIIIPQIPDYPKRKPQPLIGPFLSVYGALLWSFVIAGQFTTSWMNSGPLDEKWAVLTVFVATVVCGIVALRRASSAAPVSAGRFVGRAVFAFVGAFVAFFATVFVAAIAGNVASRNHDVLIAFALVVLAVTASVVGPRITTPGPRAAASHGSKVVQVMFWGGLAVVTFIAGAELVANG